MAQEQPIRFTQRLDVWQFNRLQNAANGLNVSKSEMTRTALGTALEKYLDALDSLSFQSRTPAA
ncbi:hypothetical protein [Coleofasciculus sp. FACHB-SPT9]|uniref:hypothetical protein n=1 Tax=Cyanophyceae TaxID=3028117 RepID=UPI001687BDAB|nr:hypothetical protein [Coleofasciculus sp. FACHB-SPT9]MBD1892930.1 hypothetical protein [Coleofasciculus sp. FACHB-SPT9]